MPRTGLTLAQKYQLLSSELQSGRIVVHKDGTVIGPRGHPVGSPQPGSGNYYRVHVQTIQGCVWFMKHHIVWMAFMGLIIPGYEINHRDGNKANNALANLELVTPSENMKHAVSAGLVTPPRFKCRGENHPCAKLTDADVAAIREIFRNSPPLSQGKKPAPGQPSFASVARQFGVDHATVGSIVHGHRR